MSIPGKKTASTRYGHGTISRAPNGRGYDAVVYVAGVRRRARLPSLPEAKAWLDAQDPGDAVTLTASQLRDAKTALALLPAGVTLTTAVTEFLKTAKAKDHPLRKTIDDFLEDRQTQLRPRTFQSYRQVLLKAAGDFPDDLSALSKPAIRDYVAPLAPHARNRAVRSLSAFFAWCVATGALDRNPAEGLRLARVAEPTRTILTIDQTRALLAHAQAHADILLPYLPICLFAGLRPDEAKRLRPEHIGKEYITLPPDITKTAQARTVPIRPNLRAILDAHPLKGHRVTNGVSPDRFAKRFSALIKTSGIAWAPDIMRHSFASYAFETSHDAADTAYQMGHRGTDVFFRHYRGLVPPTSGKDYFSITI